MKHVLLASSALCVVFTYSAFGSDLPTKKAPPPPPVAVYAPYNWTGFYIGANAGALFDPDEVDSLTRGYTFNGATSNSLSPTGFVGGVQAGYNYQISNFVLGVEGDLDFSTAKASFNYPGFSGTATHSTSWPFFADLRARAGIAFDRFLPYITGGVAFANVNNNISDPGLGSAGRGSATGWVIGGGLEYAVTDHWSAKAEYLYMQFPDVTASINRAGGYAFKFKDNAQIARVGLNYKF